MGALTVLDEEEVTSLTDPATINTNNQASTATMPPAKPSRIKDSLHQSRKPNSIPIRSNWICGFIDELWTSTDLVFQGRSTILLALGPLAVLGEATGILPLPACFAFAGIALIPCAERLSFITEQLAEHTNGTIGALLNATFGNAPELLISVAALRSGYYRVVQLAMLGSMFTNMILVFGVACIIGGLRWQVQELRLTSGNVNVLMLWLATAGLLFPASLVLTGQLDLGAITDERVPSDQEVTFSRVNAAVMLILYICFLVFQLGTHKDEFDEELHGIPFARRARRNLFCLSYVRQVRQVVMTDDSEASEMMDEPPMLKSRLSEEDLVSAPMDHPEDEPNSEFMLDGDSDDSDRSRTAQRRHNYNRVKNTSEGELEDIEASKNHHVTAPPKPAQLSMRVGIGWLFLITMCVSAVTDVLVDTIDDFARRMNISEVFTSMVIVPFFSNVAEQVSAFIFAYRNEMDLCIGVTVGSAIQIATFVLPGSVLIGMVLDRSMTLFFHGYETVSLVFGVMVLSAVLQGGTTNWLVGVILVGIYIMFAAGIWFHEVENLTVDLETFREPSHDTPSP